MSNSKDTRGSQGNAGYSPRVDRRLILQLSHKVKTGQALSQGELGRLNSIVKQTQATGDFSRKDKRALRNFLHTLRTSSGATAGKPNLGWGDMTSGSPNPNRELASGRDFRQLRKVAYPGSSAKNNPMEVMKNLHDKGLNGLPGNTHNWPKANPHPKGKGGKPSAAAASPVGSGGAKGRSTPGRRGRRGGGSGLFSPNTMEYSGFGAFPGVSRQAAKTMVAQDNKQLIEGLFNQAKNFNEDYKYDLNKINAGYDRTKGDLNYVFNEAGDVIGAKNKAIDSRFAAGSDELKAIYDRLQQTMGQTSGDNRAAALAEQQRLGVQNTGMGRFDQDANWQQMLAQQSGANAQANNTLARNSASEAGNMLASMSAASLASAQGRATNARNDASTEALQGYRQNISGIRNDMSGVIKNTPNAVRELYDAMDDKAYQRWAETNQMDWQNQMAAASFNLDVSKLNSSNLWAKRKATMEAARQRTAARQKQAELDAQRTTNNIMSGITNGFTFFGG